MEYNIFVNGLQRSGTNYLTRLISDNFHDIRNVNKAKTNSPAWKHNLVIDENLYSEARVHSPNYFVFIYKNPYTWLESICVRGGVDYVSTQLLHGDPKKIEGIKFPDTQISVSHVAKTWSTWIQNWLIDKNDIIPYNMRKYTRYEDLLNNVTREQFLESLPFKRSGSKWRNPNPGQISLSKNFKEEQIAYYKKMMPLKLTQDVLDDYNKYLTDEVLKHAGYNRLERL